MSGNIDNAYLIASIAIMAGMTYLIRVIPMAVFQKKISNRFIRSFLNYVPYGVLSAMTFPAILYSTGSAVSGAAGCIVAVVLAYCGRSLLIVAVGAALTVFLTQLGGF